MASPALLFDVSELYSDAGAGESRLEVNCSTRRGLALSSLDERTGDRDRRLEGRGERLLRGEGLALRDLGGEGLLEGGGDRRRCGEGDLARLDARLRLLSRGALCLCGLSREPAAEVLARSVCLLGGDLLGLRARLVLPAGETDRLRGLCESGL